MTNVPGVAGAQGQGPLSAERSDAWLRQKGALLTGAKHP
jgi:hypothetical protein